MAYLDNWTDENGLNITDDSDNVIEFANINIVVIANQLNYTSDVTNVLMKYIYTVTNIDYSNDITNRLNRDIYTKSFWTSENDFIVDEFGNKIEFEEKILSDYVVDIQGNIIRDRIADIDINHQYDIANIVMRIRYIINNIDYEIDISDNITRETFVNNIINYEIDISDNITRETFVNNIINYVQYIYNYPYRVINTSGYWTSNDDYITDETLNKIEFKDNIICDYAIDIDGKLIRNRYIPQRIDDMMSIDNLIAMNRYVMTNLDYNVAITNSLVRDRYSISDIDYNIRLDNNPRIKYGTIDYIFVRFKEEI